MSKPRTHDRKTASQMQLETCVLERLQQCWGFEYMSPTPRQPRLHSPATQYHTSNVHVRMSTERSSTLE